MQLSQQTCPLKFQGLSLERGYRSLDPSEDEPSLFVARLTNGMVVRFAAPSLEDARRQAERISRLLRGRGVAGVLAARY